MNHAPARIDIAVDLPAPCLPSRISTASALQPGRITRATAEIIQRVPTLRLYSLIGTLNVRLSQPSRRRSPSHTRPFRYSRTGWNSLSLATTQTASTTAALFTRRLYCSASQTTTRASSRSVQSPALPP
ncbi:hypothetical protein D3C85_1385290 [compost metagenome]